MEFILLTTLVEVGKNRAKVSFLVKKNVKPRNAMSSTELLKKIEDGLSWQLDTCRLEDLQRIVKEFEDAGADILVERI